MVRAKNGQKRCCGKVSEAFAVAHRPSTSALVSYSNRRNPTQRRDALESRHHYSGAAFDADHPARIDRSAGGAVRGLLCPRCKVGVATFRDDVERLRSALEYLLSSRDAERYSASVGA